MGNIITLPAANMPQSTDNTNLAKSAGLTPFKVEISFAKNVKQGDFNQAEITLQALQSAGLDSKLALWALEEGHGYQIESMITQQQFNLPEDLRGDFKVTQEVIITYARILRDRALLTSGNNRSETQALVPLSKSLVEVGESEKEQVIDMVAIFKLKQDLLSDSEDQSS